jgi:hypothetical protein
MTSLASHRENLHKLLDYLFDRTVILVGGSGNWEPTKLPQDAYVVHCNNHWLNYGGPVHALYHMAVGDPTKLIHKLPEIDYVMYCGHHPFSMRFNVDKPRLWDAWIQFDNRYLPGLVEHVGKVLTGAVALHHLLQHPVRMVNVVAMDNYASAAPAGIDIEAHRRWYRWVREDPRVVFCQGMP